MARPPSPGNWPAGGGSPVAGRIKQSVDIQLRRLQARLPERKLAQQVTHAAKEVLAEEGLAPVHGASPPKRAIPRRVENALAMRLMQGAF